MLDVPFRFSCISYEKSAYSQDLWSIWPQLALAPNYHGKARTDLLRREHHYMQSPFISLLLCSQAAMDEAAAWRLSSLVERNIFIWTDYLLCILKFGLSEKHTKICAIILMHEEEFFNFFRASQKFRTLHILNLYLYWIDLRR